MKTLKGRGMVLSREDQDRSNHTMESRKLKDWMDTEDSAVLVINGHAFCYPRQSALSFVSASISYALENIPKPGDTLVKRPDIVPLFFFCGEYADRTKSRNTLSGVIKSLTAQLLEWCEDLNPKEAGEPGEFDNSDVSKVFRRF